MSARARYAMLLGAVAVVLAACTTVPDSSAPDVVRSLGVQPPGPAPANIAPTPGADPRSIVIGFLAANASNDANHNSARSFLTTEAKNLWSDATVTVIDRAFTSNPDGRNRVTVTGNEIGSVDENGVYTPVLLGDGSGTGSKLLQPTFGLKQVKGQWRIDQLQKGLLITEAQFQQYQQRSLFFFDGPEEHLVPDPRYTQLADPRDLTVWLVAGLAQGPRGGLATGLADQTDPKRVHVVFPAGSSGTSRVQIEIPGAGELDTANRDRLGAQVAATLAQVPEMGQLEITDNGQPVRIPAVGGARFSTGDLDDQFTTTPASSKLFYVSGGAVYQQTGHRLPGKVGAGVYDLTSVALTERPRTAGIQVAGVRGTGKDGVLDIGTSTQLTTTKVRGELSRPAWAPGVDEVWIGDGTSLYRVSASGAAKVIPVDAPGGKASGTVTAVRLSPEGARVALVLSSNGTSQVYVGAVVRSSAGVRVTGLAPISPQGIEVRDIAWNDSLKLFAVGTVGRAGFGVYEVQCDGSVWTPKSTLGLPQAPDSVTVAGGAVAVVSTGATVERQVAGGWDGLLDDETHGANPVYLE